MCASKLNRRRSWKNVPAFFFTTAFCFLFVFPGVRSSFQADSLQDRKVCNLSSFTIQHVRPRREKSLVSLFVETKNYFTLRLSFDHSSIMQIITANAMSAVSDQMNVNNFVAVTPTLEESFSSASQIKHEQTNYTRAIRTLGEILSS